MFEIIPPYLKRLFSNEKSPQIEKGNSERNPQGDPETEDSTEQNEAKKSFKEKFIDPIQSFIQNIATEGQDALSQLKEAAQSMTYSNDIWESMHNPDAKQIGGILLPKEYPTIRKKRDDFIIASHTGFGERSLLGHDRSGEGLQDVSQKLSGLEIAVRAGANLLEVDLTLTSDGEIVLYHKMPGQKDGQVSRDEFLEQSPESMTLGETIDWLRMQPDSIQLFLEPKSDIPVADIVDQVKKVVGDNEEEVSKILERLCIYAYKTSDMINNRSGKEFLQQKAELGIPKDQLKVFYITNGILTKEAVEKILEENAGIYAFEQGMMPWGLAGGNVVGLLQRMTSLMSKSSIEEMVQFLHDQDIKIITGTANDPAVIHELVKMGFDGIVPDNPIDFEMAGIEFDSKPPQPVDYVPESMKPRLDRVNQAATRRREAEQQQQEERGERWNNRKQTVKNLLKRLGIPVSSN